MYRLDRFGVLALKSPQLKRSARCYAFLSIGGMKCDIPMFRGKNGLLHGSSCCLKVIKGSIVDIFVHLHLIIISKPWRFEHFLWWGLAVKQVMCSEFMCRYVGNVMACW
jgi:hypothetical protein